MSTSEDGTDIFEITDFTTASDFERFVAHLEEIIHEWKLTTVTEDRCIAEALDINTAQWLEVSEEISLADFPFGVTHHYMKLGQRDSRVSSGTTPTPSTFTQSGDAAATDRWSIPLKELYHNGQEFPSKVHCLCKWYGLTSFVVVSSKSYSLSEESRIKMVLSAIIVATQNTSCLVPIFVQSLEASRMYYMGHLYSPGATTSFEMVHMNRVPERYRNLNGLLDVFKGKLNMPVEPQPKADVSIRLTCILQDWEKYVFDWPQAPPDVAQALESPVIGWTTIDRLPFGTCENPIDKLYLYALWSNMSEEVLMESEIHSDLEPLYAPLWSVRVTMVKDIKGLLSECLHKFAELCESSDLPSMSKVTRAVSNTRLRLSSRAQQDSPIPFELLHKLLLHLFPDAQDDETKTDESLEDSQRLKDVFRCYKTAPLDSLVYNLAVRCCVVNYAFGGLKAVAHLWHEFVLELRYRLDNSILLPGLETGFPNLSQSILYQKLQMLNCCIERKLVRDGTQYSSVGANDSCGGTTQVHVDDSTTQVDGSTTQVDDSTTQVDDGTTQLNNSTTQVNDNTTQVDDSTTQVDVSNTESTDNEEEDEFFDCELEESEDSKVSIDATIYEESVDMQPQGRLSTLRELKLLRVDADLYIPVTQEPSPMTEDMLAEHAEMLTRLGTSAESAILRARLQSASLVSDMEAFKAANPGCVLEDFVRWYSPRDYVTETVIDSDTGDTTEKGTLSSRMLIPGNMWQEVWANAKPVPVKRQKRLFNDTKEAEKVLHYLANLTPAQVVLHLLPLACQSAILLVKKQGEELMPSITPLIESLTARLENVTRNPTQSVSIYTDSINSITTAELLISRARSLHLKFACDEINKDNEDVKKFVLNLMGQEEVKVPGAAKSPVGRTLTEMFKEAKISQNGDHQQQHQHQEQSIQFSKGSKSVQITNLAESVFPKPFEKEYILRVVTPRPAPYSQHLPQRMYCTITGHEYRLCGAFSSDITFE